MVASHNWKVARDHYINAGWLNGVTLEDTARQYDIPYQSVRRRAAREQWRLIREWQAIEPELATVEEYIYYYK